VDSVGRNEQIVSQIQSGVGDRQELLTELWVSNMGLVQKIIHQATGLQRNVHRQDFEDLEQQAFIGIMEAVRRYDPAAGVKFSPMPKAISENRYINIMIKMARRCVSLHICENA